MSEPLITTLYPTHSSINNDKTENLTVVFIHGWGVNSAVWQPIIEPLQAYVNVITIDLPGFGLNINNTVNDYSLANVTHAIQQAVEVPAVYVGWSLGGLVVTQLALSYPQKVLGCVTVASSPCFMEHEVNNKKCNAKEWLGIASDLLNMFYKQLAENTQKMLTSFLKIQAMGSPSLRNDIKVLRNLVAQYPVANEQTLHNGLQLLESTDLRNDLANLTVPLLRIYGKYDSLVSIAAIEHINALLPHSQHLLFNESSHAPFISEPKYFSQVVLSWLAEHIIDE